MVQKRKSVPPKPAVAADPPDAGLEILREAMRLHVAGRLLDAVPVYRRHLALGRSAVALNNLGAALRDLGQSPEAVDCFREALTLEPTNSDAQLNLGLGLLDLGDLAPAEAALKRALTMLPQPGPEAAADPRFLQCLNGYGSLMRRQGRVDEMIALFRQESVAAPQDANLHLHLGNILFETHRLEEAVAAFTRALEIEPKMAAALGNLGTVYATLGKLDDAVRCQRGVIALEPENPKHYVNLGAALKGQGLLGEAAAVYRHAVTLKPDYDFAINNLGNLLREQGRLDESVACFRKAIKISPSYLGAHSNLLFTLNSLAEMTPAEVCAEHRQFGDMIEAQAGPVAPHANVPEPARRLRVGYLSPDFLGHSVAYFIENLLEFHDQRNFEIICYAINKRMDSLSRRLQARVPVWRSCSFMTDDELTAQIRADQVDILVDLAGHTAENRLTVMARKPAPVQVTYLGYPNTTGLTRIDYRLTDAKVDPVGEADHIHAEKLVRLPRSFLCFRPSDFAGEVPARPVANNGYVTFGSFNVMAKMTDEVVAVWSRLLREVPNSRLVMKCNAFSDPETLALYRQRFGACGVAPERLDLMGRQPLIGDHLATYGRIDIALDPFPYNGTTTTCEALWMGVPMVALRGDRHVGRVSAALLEHVGLAELVAYSVDDYVARAKALAADPARIQALSAGLRKAMAASPLMDGPGFAREVEAAYRGMWQHWCAAQAAGSKAPDVTAEMDAGVAAFNRSDWPAAERAFRQAAAKDPTSPEAILNLGSALKRRKLVPEALACFQQALVLRPDWAAAYANIGSAFCDLGRQEEAEAACRRAIAIDPRNRNAYSNLASALCAQHRDDEAIPFFEKAIEIGPVSADLYVNLSAALISTGRLAQAAEACRRAITLAPDLAEAHANLASTLGAQGLNRETIAASREVTRLRPDLHLGWSNYLFSLNYVTDLSADQIFAEHRAWGARHAGKAARHHDNAPVPDRPLRVGFVSADFCAHSVAFFLKPLFDRHNGKSFEFYCYSDVVNPDLYTEFLRRASAGWRPIVGLSDERAAAMVRADGIDILVDLAGHTSKNRLGVFAEKPAPVQVTWLGYPNTTGLEAIDYRLIDAITDPPGDADRGHAEKLWRLPGPFLCYEAAPKTPDVAPLPALANGHITFGSFNKINKISDQTISLWAAALVAVPQSRLILKSRSFADAESAARLQAAFQKAGIAAGRVELLSWEPHLKNHLEVYHRIDLALDTFPYNGTTTICEAAWMGVPTLTLCGDRHAARVGATINAALDLPQMTALDEQAFVAQAKLLAADVPALSALRAGLRARMLESPLCDGRQFAGKFEAAMRGMWRAWCETEGAGRSNEGNDKTMATVPTNMLRLKLKGDIEICVPRDVNLISPYVLLEQEDWFEDEAPFVRQLLRPGERVIDIGANYGIYSLTAARAVGAAGQVWSFEPASQTAAHLTRSIAANGFQNVSVIQAALSNREGEAQLGLSGQSELNSLQGSAQGSETVALTTLDLWAAANDWPAIDFVKLDAEGEEPNVIRGGHAFLKRASPLIMFEIKHGAKLNLALKAQFEELGYAAYRLVPGLGILQPFEENGREDPYLLNLFCCKADKAAELRARGILADAVAADTAPAARGAWRNYLGHKPFAQELAAQWPADGQLPPGYVAALDLYVAAQDRNLSPTQRVAALEQAVASLGTLAEATPDFAVLMSLARAAADLGRRGVAVLALQRLISGLNKGPARRDLPFLAPSPRFDALPAASRFDTWCFAAVLETFERLAAYSSFYDQSHASIIDDLCKTGLQSAESERRRLLIQLRSGAGLKAPLPPAVLAESPDNLNAAFWRGVTSPPPRVDNLLELLPQTGPINIVDIGAMALGNEIEPYRPLIKAGRARVVGFEPNEAECAKLNAGTGGRYYPYFIGDGGMRTFHETNMPMTGSLYQPNTPLLSRFSNLAELVTPKMQHPGIETRRLDDLADLDGLSDIDLIKIDVQGGELDVFRGASKALGSALMIITEVEFVELYVGQPLFADVDQHLRKNGYQFHTFLGFGQRLFKPLSSPSSPSGGIRQILWSDAVYVRDFMQFDRLEDEKLLKLSLMLDSILQSADLAALALKEYDRRRGTTYADTYVAGIIAKSAAAKPVLPQ
ncbi:FkbM family methyltransferase [Dongia rigui]|uniref:protein O-GlcNAc transferase n=1 Tax=Dongia rigui TaxID=940149 RepID=A0ABU5E2I1_9PROT|nr:FkbM family methyltransferase [Dongia rigui]MDY0873795.1 FkbM family methyltransferase [Dongia rigui]